MQYCDGFSAPYSQSIAKRTPRQAKERLASKNLRQTTGFPMQGKTPHGLDTVQFSGNKYAEADAERHKQLMKEINALAESIEEEKKPPRLTQMGKLLGGAIGLKGTILSMGSDGFAFTAGGAALGAKAANTLGRKLGLIDTERIQQQTQAMLARQKSCERLQQSLDEGEKLCARLETISDKADKKVEVDDNLAEHFSEEDYQALHQSLHHDYYELENAAIETRTRAGKVAGFAKNYEEKVGEPLEFDGLQAVFQDLEQAPVGSDDQDFALKRLQAFAKIHPEKSNQISEKSRPYAEAQIKHKDQTALIEAALVGNLENLKQLLKKPGMNLDFKDQDGNTALHLAANNGYPEIAKMLLDKGANPDLQNKNDSTALHLAAGNGDPKIVQMLLDKNANPDLQNKYGNTALILAASKGHPKIVQMLLDKNANPDLKNTDSNTALILAEANDHPEIAKMLLNKNANPDLKNNDSNTALIWAAANGHLEIVQMMLNKNANPALQNKNGNTARRIAENKGHTHIAEMLARAEAEWEARRQDSSKVECSSSASGEKASSPLRMSPTRAASPVRSPSREEPSPIDIVMKHYKKQKPLTEYPGDYQKLLDQTMVDYMALRLKDDLEGEKSAPLKAKLRLGSQYGKETPEEIRAFWDKVCQQATNQTVPELLGTSKKGLACIAGMEDLKKKVRTSFVNPYLWHSNPDRFRKPDGTLPNIKLNNPAKGLLLYGLEGNGKSYLAEKLAEEMDRPYITLRPSDIGSKYHGESEKAVRSAFEKAEEQQPSFLIIDEIDSFLSQKEGMHHADVKIINELMTQLEEAPKKGITVIGTTNHVGKLEKAAVRDGRFSVQLEVPPPDKTSRLAMWNMFLQEATADGSLPFTEPEREELAQLTRGCSTARIKNLVEQAAEKSIEELKDLDLDIIKDLIHEKGPSYNAERMAPYEHIN